MSEDVKHVPFGWAGPGLRHQELCRPLERISAWFYHPAWRGASTVTLWRTDGSGLKTSNRMHDVVSRLEVGVLNFEVVERTDFNEQSLNLHGKFSDGIRASKLSITESGVTLECGIVLTGVDQIFIAPGAFPMTLALKGIEFDSPARDPEYPWDEYERSEL